MGGISTIEESIVRILRTPLGVRVMRPEYGSLLYTLRDKKFDDDFRLKAARYSYEAIKKNEPRVAVEKVDFKIDAVTGIVSLIVILKDNKQVEVSL